MSFQKTRNLLLENQEVIRYELLGDHRYILGVPHDNGGVHPTIPSDCIGFYPQQLKSLEIQQHQTDNSNTDEFNHVYRCMKSSQIDIAGSFSDASALLTLVLDDFDNGEPIFKDGYITSKRTKLCMAYIRLEKTIKKCMLEDMTELRVLVPALDIGDKDLKRSLIKNIHEIRRKYHDAQLEFNSRLLDFENLRYKYLFTTP